ncbi:polyketide synthase dehydratase domain-containing protein [Motilimonas pumila]|uniref:PKS/mFAS DH domain-containing protein n=1 Tax=Motilimonas pumila TaxID=2303987 RepID=A0A418YIF3_9GAMM|nr:polyketide synthase dehydratase domain-containing protein [Motilimonas pumila]RJG50436.1 hypothetical protein D1Z90_02860 [Motilimonas pumila]
MPSNYFFIHWAKDVAISPTQLSFSFTYDATTMPAMADHFFADHCLVPAAMTNEMFIQAAVALAQVDDYFPIAIDHFRVDRALSFALGQQQQVCLHCEQVAPLQFQLTLTTDLYNKAGKLTRRGVTVACASIRLQAKLPENLPAVPMAAKLDHYAMPATAYYQHINHTHGPLFQTMTGQFSLDPKQRCIASTFNIQRHEAQFSQQPDLAFICSPLAIDSVLQTAVLNCIQIESQDKPTFYSKLPVQMQHVYILQAFNMAQDYHCQGAITLLQGPDQHMNFRVHDRNGECSAYFGHIGLKHAPIELRNSIQFDTDLACYRQQVETAS